MKIIENIYFLKKFNYKLFNFSSKFYSVLIAISPCKTHILVEKHVISKITATAQIFSPKNFMIDFFSSTELEVNASEYRRGVLWVPQPTISA